MSLRISFCGPSGTGKTTLAEWVASEYGLSLNPVGARSVAAAMGYTSPYDVDKDGKRAEFQRRLIAEKVRWEADHEDFVTDRTPLDNLTYAIMHDVRAIDAELLALGAKGCRRYTHVIQCPMRSFHRSGDDPARVHDPTYHELFEMVLEGMLRRHVREIRRYELDCTQLETRREEVRMYLTPGVV